MNPATLKHNPAVDGLRLALDAATLYLRRRWPVVIVLAMPKTGGTSVHHSLARCVPNAVFHVHTLRYERISERIAASRARGEGYRYSLSQARMLRRRIDGPADHRWKVISVVRDPIARQVSLFFQTGKAAHAEFLDGDGRYVIDAVVGHLSALIAGMPHRPESRECEWLRTELLDTMGVDVFDHPVDPASGVLAASGPKVDLLMMRLEGLDDTFGSAVQRFLGLPEPVPVAPMNRTEDKAHADEYRSCVERLRFPEETLRAIYADRFCRHFYPPDMIDRFVRRWSRGAAER